MAVFFGLSVLGLTKIGAVLAFYGAASIVGIPIYFLIVLAPAFLVFSLTNYLIEKSKYLGDDWAKAFYATAISLSLFSLFYGLLCGHLLFLPHINLNGDSYHSLASSLCWWF